MPVGSPHSPPPPPPSEKVNKKGSRSHPFRSRRRVLLQWKQFRRNQTLVHSLMFVVMRFLAIFYKNSWKEAGCVCCVSRVFADVSSFLYPPRRGDIPEGTNASHGFLRKWPDVLLPSLLSFCCPGFSAPLLSSLQASGVQGKGMPPATAPGGGRRDTGFACGFLKGISPR